MKSRIIFPLAFFLSFLNLEAQEHFPGGVAGAEAWYIARYEDNEFQPVPNHGTPHIVINACDKKIGEPVLFNFNHSFNTSGLCLEYKAPLENSTSRNVFFVGEPKSLTDLSHLTTDWNEELVAPQSTDIRNRFHLSNDEAFVDNQKVTYQGISNANINFYNWNIYQTDRKFKSHGMNGETSFFIGKGFWIDAIDAKFYAGNFPEFISFPFELTANQRNRVDSYLALKYGITLFSKESYRSSRNIIFWKTSNNNLFGNRIFGIGRDDISGLHQLQSESVHQKDFLIASVGELAENNVMKQKDTEIHNSNFIVFGDNGRKPVIDMYYKGIIKKIERVWLSQNTGDYSDRYDIQFRLNLDGELKERLLEDPHQKIWMMRDRFVNNQQQSDFQGQDIDYYPASDILGNADYAIFKNIYFDRDRNIHDQFTFGIGPEMIVQVQIPPGSCDGKSTRATVLVAGGTPPYTINIVSPNGSETFVITGSQMVFIADMQSTYEVTAVDANGVTATTAVDTYLPQLDLDLGPDQFLSASQPQITLNASQVANDPDATYQWYHNGVLLEHYDAVLVVSMPGEYAVTVTSSNRMCQMYDAITISYNFSGTLEPASECGEPQGSITLNTSGGIPPFTTVISGSGQPMTLVHNTEGFVFTGINFGQHTVTTTDSNGQAFQGTVLVQDPLGGIELDLVGLVTQLCGEPFYLPEYSYPYFGCPEYNTNLSIDSSILVTNPNATYEWFSNGQSLGINSPVLEMQFEFGNNTTIVTDLVLVIKENETECILTQGVTLKGPWLFSEGHPAGRSAGLPAQVSPGAGDKPFLTAIVYPNPSERDATFYYEVSSSETFEGTVEIFSPTGALLYQVPINGKSSYTLPFSLFSSGIYLICTKTNGNIITDKIIIK